MAVTPGGTPYVESSDLVANYPAVSLSLANHVDTKLGQQAINGILFKAANYTITVGDIQAGYIIGYFSSSPGTFTLPTSALTDGMRIKVLQMGTASVSVTGGTILGWVTTTARYETLEYVWYGSGWYPYANSSPATWEAYTPTIGGTGWAIGNGTATGSYQYLNRKTVAFKAIVAFGSTSTFGAGRLQISAPFTISNALGLAGAVKVQTQYQDTSLGNNYTGTGSYLSTNLYECGTIGTNGLDQGVISSTPFTWANTDQVRINGIIEV